MTDDRLMLAARAAGYSMIPPQEVCDGDTGMDSCADSTTVDFYGTDASYLAKLRSYFSMVSAGGHATALRGAVANWLHSRAHA
jgi:hypothetical protein